MYMIRSSWPVVICRRLWFSSTALPLELMFYERCAVVCSLSVAVPLGLQAHTLKLSCEGEHCVIGCGPRWGLVVSFSGRANKVVFVSERIVVCLLPQSPAVEHNSTQWWGLLVWVVVGLLWWLWLWLSRLSRLLNNNNNNNNNNSNYN